MSHCPPSTIDELVLRARAFAGLRLGHVAAELDLAVPADLRRHKGWVGRLFEQILGADGGSRAGADFARLGVELKTIPVNRAGRPLETTFVCSVPLANPDDVTWKTSTAYDKLKQVLWIPVLAEPDLRIADRMVGTALLWSPSPPQHRLLADDWRAHLDTIRRGYVENITADDGVALQIRPKAASASSQTWCTGPDGESIMTLPRGFYLRRSFTESLLAEHLAAVV